MAIFNMDKKRDSFHIYSQLEAAWGKTERSNGKSEAMY